MKKVKIFKNQIMTHGVQFKSQDELDSWLLKHTSKNTFGLPERPELDAEGNSTGVILPAEYEIVIEDITAQVEQEKINAEALAYLASTDWLIIREIDAGVFCPLEIKQKRQEARAKIVK
jgi:hypothetical protein